MGLRLLYTILILCLLTTHISAQSNSRPLARLDSLSNIKIDEKTEEFFRKISIGKKQNISNILFRSLFIQDDSADVFNPNSIVNDELQWRKFNDKIINKIEITTLNVFPGNDSLMNSFQRIANKTHMTTRPHAIQRFLLFKSGEKFNAYKVAATQVYLRNMDIFSNVSFFITPSKIYRDRVDIHIVTNDQWSIGIDISTPRINRLYTEIYDDNLLGLGYSLKFRTYFHTSGNIYAGNQVSLKIPNIAKTFTDLNLVAGRGYDRYIIGSNINKNILTIDDYGFGLFAKSERWDYDFITCDSTHTTSNEELKIWFGKSFKINNNLALFITTSGEISQFHLRPEVKMNYNTMFHNRKIALLSVGLYNEQYYTNRYIYGYGQSEDIPYGYNLSLTGGITSCEFDDKLYFGAATSFSYPTKFGHLQFSAAFGTKFNSRHLDQTNMNIGVNWFSNLQTLGRSNIIRQFLSCWLTMGFNRHQGEGEVIGFTHDYSPRDLSRKDIFGTKRLLVKSETVFFSGLNTYGFKFAFFGFADAAWLGDQAIFRNDFYGSMGVGIRIKNERLIFHTIQLRLAIPFYKNGIYRGHYAHISQEPRLHLPSLKPTAPQILPYR